MATRKFLAGLAATFILAVSPKDANAAIVAELILEAEPDNQFIRSAHVFYDAFSEQVRGSIRGRLEDGSPAKLLFVLVTPPGVPSDDAIMIFGTDKLGIPIQPGTYTDAQRADFAEPGHPGFEFGFRGQGIGTEGANFTIRNVSFFTKTFNEELVATFDTSFELVGYGPVFGRFRYNAAGLSDEPNPSGNPIPEPASIYLLGSGFLGLAGWQRRQRSALSS